MFPVRYHDGQIQMAVNDIMLADGAFTFVHSRKYDNLEVSQSSGSNGRGWKIANVPTTTWYPRFWRTEFSERDAIHFATVPNASGVYPALQDYPETMQIDAVNKTIQVTRSNNSVWIFNNDPAGNAPVGSLLSVVGTDGTVATVVYDASKRLQTIQTRNNTQPNQIRSSLEYTWNASGKIAEIVFRQWNGSVLQPIQRVSYAYYAGADAFGNSGDLKTAIIQIADGNNWTAGETFYYRYYKPGDPKGKAHLLKMAFFPEDFNTFADTFGATACFNVADSGALNFSTKYYEYDSRNRVILEKVARNTKVISFEYVEYPEVRDFNAVHRKTVETGVFGEQNIVFTNFKGTVLLQEQKPPQGSNEETVVHYRVFNDDGKPIRHYHPKAVVSYSIVPGTPTTLKVVLSQSEGMVETTTYLNDSVAAGRRNIIKETIQQGTNGTPIIKSQRDYEKRQVGAKTAWNVISSTVYEDDANTKLVTTLYAYTYHPNSLKVEQKTTILPAVPTTQNGSGASTTRIDRFDAQGRLIWAKDELGIISYRQYNAVTGLLIKQIQDVNTMQVADFAVPVPSGWATIVGAGKHLVSEFEYDAQGRVIQTLGPRNTAVNDSNQSIDVRSASWTVYDDANATVKSASGFATMNGNNITGYTLVNPVSITIRNAEGNTLEQIRASRASVSGKLLATDTFVRSSYTAWSKNIYQDGKLVATRQYHVIPPNGDGTKDVNFLETTYGYDTFGRQNKTISPDGTITKTEFDWRGNAIATLVGTTDQNLVVVSETEYGGTGVCVTCSCQKNKPRVAIQHVDNTTMRITEFGYDWRGRQIFTFGEEDASGNITYTKQTYDNLGRAVVSERFLLTENVGSAQPTGSERLAVLRNNLSDDRLLARSENFYDVRGRVWKTEQSVVNPATGIVQGKLLGQTWFDAAGRVIKSIESGASHFSKFAYDSLGRVTRSYVATNPSESGYAAASSLTNNTVFSQSETTFDNTSNAIVSTQIERLSNAVGTGALTISTGRFQSVASWFDGFGRSLASANYGTNNGVALSRPTTVPARSNDVLVSETRYDSAAGRAYRSIDPAGKDHRTFVDALGRTIRTVANYVTGTPGANPDQDVTVEITYHPSGQILSLIAKNATTGDQVTRYVYGTAKAWQTPLIYRNDMLAAEIYPDSDDSENVSGVLQAGTDGVVDRVEFLYNRIGERIAKRDQNGTVHTYEYDNLGRLLHDRITTLASGIDGAVQWISIAYDVVGNVKSVTSYDVSFAAKASSAYAWTRTFTGQVLDIERLFGNKVLKN